MASRGSETEFELTTIERLEKLEYEYIHGEELERPKDEVVLKDALRAFLKNRYKDLPESAIEEAVRRFSRPEGVDTLRRNMAFHNDLIRGFELKYKLPNGKEAVKHVYPVNWDEPDVNQFLTVNQFPIHGKNDRRPDVIIFINGLPLVVFELKNPYDELPTVEEALNQIAHYRNDIPQLFEFNAITVISDGITTLHGMWTADMEWYAPWKSIDGFNIEANTKGSMKTLVEGLFQKERLLAFIRDFILFEVANEKITKKGAKYHQFFAVKVAVDKTLEACRSKSEKRIGVIWHTTGSGKSLSMTFLVGILRRLPELENPTFVIQVDRTDLDDQLHDQFVFAKTLVGDVKHAESVDQLRDFLKTEGGEVIFTTIEKFRLSPEEMEHPRLSNRPNVIIIADEAHRSQYGFMAGYARYLAEALPNARRIGFTGTPVSFSGADTVEIFGEVIHSYDIKQSELDNTTKPIFYEPRQVKLHLKKQDIDTALKDIADEYNVSNLERKKSKWAALAAAAGAKERLEKIAKDLLDHFLERSKTLEGKAIVVCMSRENCVRLYNALTVLPNCPEVKIVMTGNLGDDPEEWSRDGHLTTKPQRDTIKKRMIDPDDPLKIVIVCDMWLTGTDIPCLHTLYIDKPMKGHSIIQAISRVNRVFRDKPSGLVVDYIGIGDELREATAQYTKGGGQGNPAPTINDAAKPLFLDARTEILKALPERIEYGNWRKLTRIDLEDRYSLVYGYLTEEDERRDKFLQIEHKLSNTYILLKHLDEFRPYADEVIFCQRVRKQLQKSLPGVRPKRDAEKAVRDLVDDSIDSEGVVDIFQLAGIKKVDVSILDEKFLQTYKDKPLENLRLKLLEKLILDEIHVRQRRNLAKAKSFRQMLEETLQKYHNRLIDAAAVIKAMLEIKEDMENTDKRAADLGLSDEEIAFYDAVAENYQRIYDEKFLSDLIHEVVQTIKRNLKVDWTQPHRDDVKSAVRAAVKRVLRNKGVKVDDLEPFVARFMAQAEALYASWPVVA